MNLIKAEKGTLSFQIVAKEKRLLFQVLSLYPLIPPAHAQISKSEDRPADQQLLEEALAAQRLEQKKRVMALLKAKTVFHPNEAGFRFTLKAAQVEWLLQVLNDVRVGAWLALGSPDGPKEILAALNEKSAPYLWAMEVAGQFLMELLKASNPS